MEDTPEKGEGGGPFYKITMIRASAVTKVDRLRINKSGGADVSPSTPPTVIVRRTLLFFLPNKRTTQTARGRQAHVVSPQHNPRRKKTVPQPRGIRR